MKKLFQTTLLSALLLGMGAPAALAVPARPGVRTVTQPDGTTIDVVLRGDENCHYYTTADGYMLTQAGGRFYYATVDEATGLVVNSQRPAADASARTAADVAFLSTPQATEAIRAFTAEVQRRGKSRTLARTAPRAYSGAEGDAPEGGYPKGPGLFPSATVPTSGVHHGLVILVEYQDIKFKLDDPVDYFTRLLNEEGFNDYQGTGSARDFFLASSGGVYQPTFDVYGPITLKNNRSYYGANDYYGYDLRPEEMVVEACDQLDDVIDFADYDSNGDGKIDFVYVFYAGFGEADGGPSSSVWPHSYDMESCGVTKYYDGKKLNDYACSHEWTLGSYTSGTPSGIGTFSHEFGHVLGLPDLYNTSYGSSFDPGDWDIMASGSYNNDERTPPSYSGFERYALGWIEPMPITGPANGRLTAMSESPQCYIIQTNKSNEYFILENRQQSGWDAYIPGHGMLIWHIDYNESVWTDNKCNNTASHQYVDIEEADNVKSESTRDADPFPGTKGITSFTDDTTPNMKTWAGVRMELPITEIAENAGIITFKVAGGLVNVDPTTIHPDALEVTSTSFTAEWDAVADATNYRVTLTGLNASGVNTVISGYNNYNVGNVTSYTFSGLQPESEYTLTVTVENNGTLSEASAPVTFTTEAPGFTDMAVQLLEVRDVESEGFTACWEELAGATDYVIDVYQKEVAEPQEEVCDFTGGISAMPSGWSTSSNNTYSSADYSGEAAPSLKLGTDGASLQSPTFDEDITAISFWYRGANASADNSLSISVLIAGTWTSLGDIELDNAAGGSTWTRTFAEPGVRALKLVYNKVGSGNVAIDDVKVTHGGTVTVIPVAGYDDALTGLVTAYEVFGLQPLTDYCFTVQGVNEAGERSLKSAEGRVTTSPQSSSSLALVGSMSAAEAAEGFVFDLEGHRVSQPQPGHVYIVVRGTEARKVLVR